MSRITIGDLSENRSLDIRAMRKVRGGNSALAHLGPAAAVDINISQKILQLQNVEVNALNNVGVIGAGFGPLKLNVSPSQWAAASVAV